MPDKEKIIKAVEEAFDLVYSDFIGTDDFNETEWEQNKADALELLKEQETSDTNQSRIFHCKKCGYGIDDIYLTDESAYPIEPNYCPNCGRLVKWK